MTPTRLLAAGLGLALLPFGAAPASAAADSAYYGECDWTALIESATFDDYAGEMHAVVLLYSPDGGVVSGTVTCELRVNDVPQDVASASGTGVVVVADVLTYTATDTDEVEMCTIVDFTSDATPTQTSCKAPSVIRLPPDCGGCSVVDIVLDALAPVWTLVDPILCAALGALSPGIPPVTIEEDGDGRLAGELVWDCPPYVQ